MSEEGATLRLGGAAARTLASELRVTVVDGPDAGRPAVTSRGASMIVGRAEAADLRLTDPAVSAFHVALGSVPGGVSVRDEGSRNGTFVEGGVRVLSAVVPPGTILTIGKTRIGIDRIDATGNPPEQLASFGRMRASSPIMRGLFAVLERLAATDLSVLVEGATGTGKELVAQGLHDRSARAKGPFVVLDCTSIPRNLAESVLFGHERGAFTGAEASRPGIFEAAEGGTVFLDEIGDLPAELQPKLLRVLEKREVVRVGDARPRPIDVRLVAATWRDLRRMVNDGSFREDLYFRVAQARVGLPTLAERPEDVSTLVYHFLQTLPASVPGARMITRDALDELKKRAYPGNVRELRSIVERAAMLAQGESITLADLGFEQMIATQQRHAPTPGAALLAASTDDDELPRFKEAKRTLVDDFERGYLESLMQRCGENLSRASVLSGIERHHLRDLLKKHGLRGK